MYPCIFILLLTFFMYPKYVSCHLALCILGNYTPSTKYIRDTVKPVLSGHLKIDKTQVLMENGSLMKVESIAECSPWGVLKYFRPT